MVVVGHAAAAVEARLTDTLDARRIRVLRNSKFATLNNWYSLLLALDMPQGTINLNAAPWAEVFIDGKRVGETPIGNLSIAIGAHEVLFRHPQLGEKRQAVSVTLKAPVRLSVDMK